MSFRLLRMPKEPLQIEDLSDHPNGKRVLRLSGPLIISNLFEFQSLVRANISPRLVLDFTNVPYIDSAGIGALVGAYVSHQKEGRSLVMVGVNDRVRGSLQVTRVEHFFSFFSSVDEVA